MCAVPEHLCRYAQGAIVVLEGPHSPRLLVVGRNGVGRYGHFAEKPEISESMRYCGRVDEIGKCNATETLRAYQGALGMGEDL